MLIYLNMKKIFLSVFLYFSLSFHAMAGIGQSYHCDEIKIIDINLDSSTDMNTDYMFQFTWYEDHILTFNRYDDGVDEYKLPITSQSVNSFSITETDDGYTMVDRFDSTSNLYSFVTLEESEVEVSLSTCYPIDHITFSYNQQTEEQTSPQSGGVFIQAIEDLLLGKNKE